MANYSRTSIFYGTPQTGPATRLLVGLLVGASVFAALAGRFGLPIFDLLRFSVPNVLRGELWRLLTYAFLRDSPVSLVLSAVVVFLFARTCESSWGARDFLRFFLLSSVGGAACAIPLHLLINVTGLFGDAGRALGPDAAIDAMMVAMVLNAPDTKVMFGFILPMPAKQVILLLLGFEVLAGLMDGLANLSITLGGMLMGYLLVTGIWRPKRLLEEVVRWRQRRRRRIGLYVVPPKRRGSPLN